MTLRSRASIAALVVLAACYNNQSPEPAGPAPPLPSVYPNDQDKAQSNSEQKAVKKERKTENIKDLTKAHERLDTLQKDLKPDTQQSK